MNTNKEKNNNSDYLELLRNSKYLQNEEVLKTLDVILQSLENDCIEVETLHSKRIFNKSTLNSHIMYLKLLGILKSKNENGRELVQVDYETLKRLTINTQNITQVSDFPENSNETTAYINKIIAHSLNAITQVVEHSHNTMQVMFREFSSTIANQNQVITQILALFAQNSALNEKNGLGVANGITQTEKVAPMSQKTQNKPISEIALHSEPINRVITPKTTPNDTDDEMNLADNEVAAVDFEGDFDAENEAEFLQEKENTKKEIKKEERKEKSTKKEKKEEKSKEKSTKEKEQGKGLGFLPYPTNEKEKEKYKKEKEKFSENSETEENKKSPAEIFKEWELSLPEKFSFKERKELFYNLFLNFANLLYDKTVAMEYFDRAVKALSPKFKPKNVSHNAYRAWQEAVRNDARAMFAKVYPLERISPEGISNHDKEDNHHVTRSNSKPQNNTPPASPSRVTRTFDDDEEVVVDIGTMKLYLPTKPGPFENDPELMAELKATKEALQRDDSAELEAKKAILKEVLEKNPHIDITKPLDYDFDALIKAYNEHINAKNEPKNTAEDTNGPRVNNGDTPKDTNALNTNAQTNAHDPLAIDISALNIAHENNNE
jgi:hypothetical protein